MKASRVARSPPARFVEHLLVVVVALAGGVASAAPPEAADLIAVAEDADRPIAVTKKAVEDLGGRADPRAVPVLVKLLYQDRQGRTLAPEAALALFQIGRPSADALLRVVRRKDPELFAWASANHIAETWLFAQAADVLGDLGESRAQAPLLELLRFEDPSNDSALGLAVRRRAASALGRLRSQAAVAPVASQVNVQNLQARHEFVRALILIGGRGGLAALGRAASEGEWDVRKIAMDGFTMLGDDREQDAYKKMLEHEEEIITSDCQAHPNYQGCNDLPATLNRVLSVIRGYSLRLDSAARCKQNVGCWTERLKDADPGVRQRAVLEISRRVSVKQLDLLVAAVGDADPTVRFAAVQSLERLLTTDAAARAEGKRHLAALEGRLAQDQDTVAGARFDAPLRRIIWRIRSAH